MKKNSFRLQAYLRIKEFEEKLSWSEVLTQMGRVNTLIQKMTQLSDQQKSVRKKTSLIGLNGGPQMYELSLAGESLEGTSARIDSLKLELRSEEKVLERLRLKHVEAKRELKTIEKVKENDRVRYKQLKDKMDLKTTSEIALQMHNRAKVENE